MTRGAVSRHIKTLEGHLGVRLFRRLTRRTVLTDEGARFHEAVSRLLAELIREADHLRGQKSGALLRSDAVQGLNAPERSARTSLQIEPVRANGDPSGVPGAQPCKCPGRSPPPHRGHH